MFALRKKYFFNGKPKMTKQFEFEKLKIPNTDIWPFWEIFNFFKFNLFCHFWFPIKKIFFFSKQTYFCLTKFFFGIIALIEKKIYYKR